VSKLSTYLKARKAVSVETAGGLHRTLEPGEVVSSDELAAQVVSRWEDGEAWLANLFEEAKKEEYDGVPVRGPASDAHTRQLEAVEALGRERAVAPLGERLGSEAPSTETLNIGDAHRTLPASGADLETDTQFAGGSADTSEAVDPAKGEGEDLTSEEFQPGAVSDLPRAGDPPIVEAKPKKARGKKGAVEEEPAAEEPPAE
jgi:hypothetical protein